jgi:hypothetical protein
LSVPSPEWASQKRCGDNPPHLLILSSDPIAGYRDIAGSAIGKGKVSETCGVAVPEIEYSVPEDSYRVFTNPGPVTSSRNIPGYSIPEDYVSCTVIVAIQRPYAIPEYTGPDR